MFPITISFTVSTPAELDRLVAATEFTAPAEKPATEPAKQEVKKPDPKPETPEAAKSAPPADTPATPEPTAAASGTLDYDKDVKPAFLKLVQSKGRASGRKIIDAFAPTKEKLSEAITTQEQYGQALKLIAKEMGA
jgi:hypothetical protein